MDQNSKADLLRKLHSGPDILVLPNAWDAISARIIEAEGSQLPPPEARALQPSSAIPMASAFRATK
jgi:hypothetical protein